MKFGDDPLPFHGRGRYHIETSPMIWSGNQWTGFYMITASVMKGLTLNTFIICDVISIILDMRYVNR